MHKSQILTQLIVAIVSLSVVYIGHPLVQLLTSRTILRWRPKKSLQAPRSKPRSSCSARDHTGARVYGDIASQASENEVVVNFNERLPSTSCSLRRCNVKSRPNAWSHLVGPRYNYISPSSGWPLYISLATFLYIL